MIPVKPSDKELDGLFREYIRLRDYNPLKPECPLCKERYSATRMPNVCHFMARRYTSTRWHPFNAILACAVCNNQEVFIGDQIEDRFGEKAREDMLYRAKNIVKPDRFKIKEDLERMVNDEKVKKQLALKEEKVKK